jgi:hypothetical protein
VSVLFFALVRRNAGSSRMSTLARLSLTWASLRAPMIGIAGVARCQSHAKATWAGEWPHSRANATTSRTMASLRASEAMIRLAGEAAAVQAPGSGAFACPWNA